MTKGEGTPFPCGKKGFPPPGPLLPQKPLITTACLAGSLFLWLPRHQAHARRWEEETPAQRGCSIKRPSIPAGPAGSPIFDKLTGKSFWKGGVRGGRTFFQKGFPPRCFPCFKSSSAACNLPLPARVPLRGDWPHLGTTVWGRPPVELSTRRRLLLPGAAGHQGPEKRWR